MLLEIVATFMNFASLPENLCVIPNKDGRPNNGGDVQTSSTTQPCVSVLTNGDLSGQPDPNHGHLHSKVSHGCSRIHQEKI